MKPIIAITLIIIVSVFGFISGYIIGSHSDQATRYRMTNKPATKDVLSGTAPSPGYGTPSPGYGTPSPGYGTPSPASGQ